MESFIQAIIITISSYFISTFIVFGMLPLYYLGKVVTEETVDNNTKEKVLYGFLEKKSGPYPFIIALYKAKKYKGNDKIVICPKYQLGRESGKELFREL